MLEIDRLAAAVERLAAKVGELEVRLATCSAVCKQDRRGRDNWKTLIAGAALAVAGGIIMKKIGG